MNKNVCYTSANFFIFVLVAWTGKNGAGSRNSLGGKKKGDNSLNKSGGLRSAIKGMGKNKSKNRVSVFDDPSQPLPSSPPGRNTTPGPKM